MSFRDTFLNLATYSLPSYFNSYEASSMPLSSGRRSLVMVGKRDVMDFLYPLGWWTMASKGPVPFSPGASLWRSEGRWAVFRENLKTLRGTFMKKRIKLKGRIKTYIQFCIYLLHRQPALLPLSL